MFVGRYLVSFDNNCALMDEEFFTHEEKEETYITYCGTVSDEPHAVRSSWRTTLYSSGLTSKSFRA